MATPSFDSTRAIRFDLPSGAVRAGNGNERLVLVPSPALEDLLARAPGDAVNAFGKSLGAVVGGRALARVAVADRDGASVEELVTQIAGEAALAGLGALSVERWGYALVVVLEGSPLPVDAVPSFVAGLIEALSGRSLATTLLSNERDGMRVLVASERGVQRVRDWIESGSSWGDALTKLHGEGA